MHRMSLFVVVFAASTLACSSKDDATPAEDPAEHACEHASEAGTPISAAADRPSAPALTIAEAPYTVTLVSGAPGFLKMEGPLEALLLSGKANVVTALYHADSTTDELPAGSPNEFCAAAIPEHYDLDLHESGTFFVQLGPAQVPDVWLMLSSAAGHAH